MEDSVEDTSIYLGLVAELRVGKRLPQAVYLHHEALSLLSPALYTLVERLANTLPADVVWNVVKLHSIDAKISFLSYPRFFEDAFPSLARAMIVEMESGAVSRRDYEGDNPPILHRKETLLPPGHTSIPRAAALTMEAERVGLFEASRDIGYLRAWEDRLMRVGLRVEGDGLVQVQPETIHRHRTALSRSALSTPMQALWRHGFLSSTRSVFDYGCGRGDDVRALTQHGIDAAGWDPHFAASQPKRTADVVNLGFVLNVIEDLDERRDALRGAWALTETVLAVSVLIGGRDAYERFRLFGDGVLTTRGTFQKYFSSSEFRAYLEEVLGREPVALAPGIAFVFRSDEDEQQFLAGRIRHRVAPTEAPQPERQERAPRSPAATRAPRQRKPEKWEVHAELADSFWRACVRFGRLPESDEFDRYVELRANLGSAGTVLRALTARRGNTEILASERAHRDDVLVFLALNFFERRRSLHALPEIVRRDVKSLFGSYQAAQAAAQALLFSVGKTESIHAAAVEAAGRSVGCLDGSHSLQLHSSRAHELPAALRVYLGCAARLYGDVENADVVKIHIRSGKVSLMSYDDFEGRSLPNLIERVKINLRKQQIDFFEYGTTAAPSQPLYLKSRFMAATQLNYEEQCALDASILSVPGLDLRGFGPTRATYEATLTAAGLSLSEFDRALGIPRLKQAPTSEAPSDRPVQAFGIL